MGATIAKPAPLNRTERVSDIGHPVCQELAAVEPAVSAAACATIKSIVPGIDEGACKGAIDEAWKLLQGVCPTLVDDLVLVGCGALSKVEPLITEAVCNHNPLIPKSTCEAVATSVWKLLQNVCDAGHAPAA